MNQPEPTIEELEARFYDYDTREGYVALIRDLLSLARRQREQLREARRMYCNKAADADSPFDAEEHAQWQGWDPAELWPEDGTGTVSSPRSDSGNKSAG